MAGFLARGGLGGRGPVFGVRRSMLALEVQCFGYGAKVNPHQAVERDMWD